LESLGEQSDRCAKKLNIQVKIDTGLHRAGCELSKAKMLIEKVQRDRRFELTGVLTHFSSAVDDEQLTKLQHDRFDQVIHTLSTPLSTNCVLHEANTAATVQWKWTHRDMVRVGLAWLGSVPNGVCHEIDFRPVIAWRSRLAHVRKVEVGERVGYSGKWSASRSSSIGNVPVGYASGFPMGVGTDGNCECAYVRVFDNKFDNLLGEAPVVGSVCMDQISIDLTDVSGSGVGCGIELISADITSKSSLEYLAKIAGVVPHAIVSRISPKVHRSYLSSNANLDTVSIHRKHA
jgi:alanine racemase